jgi:hypothetical protein
MDVAHEIFERSVFDPISRVSHSKTTLASINPDQFSF